MTLVIMMALGVGVGGLGIVAGLRGHRTSLQGLLTGLTAEQHPVSPSKQVPWQAATWRFDRRMALSVANTARERGLFDRELGTRLALANSSLEELANRCLLCASIGLLIPMVLWGIVVAGGARVHVVIAVAACLALGFMGALLPIAELNAKAKRGRRHAQRAICSFLDLVVLGLAGGMGIESALLTAAQIGENVVSRRMFAALSMCRDTGEPLWSALARLGETLGIEALSELAAAAGLAGMEGAKVRATLAARASSIRSHELANAEAEANALTEKLFIPGAFLLVGFLVFIGYPAFTRITSGF